MVSGGADVPEVGPPVFVPTRAGEGFEVAFAQVCSAIETCRDRSIEAIGICAPGPLNPKTGIVINPPNLPGWERCSSSDRAQ